MIPWEKVIMSVEVDEQKEKRNKSIVPGPGEKGFKIVKMKSSFGLFEKTVLLFLQYSFIICYICLSLSVSPTYSLPINLNTQQPHEYEYSLSKSINIPLLPSTSTIRTSTEEPDNNDRSSSSSSMIVRVIVSSSSTSSASSRTNNNNANNNANLNYSYNYNRPSRSNHHHQQQLHFPNYQHQNQPLPTTTPQPFLPPPTTYHPPVSFFLSSLPSHPIPISQSIRRFGSPQAQFESQTSSSSSSSPHPQDIFSVFYHAFSQQHPNRRVDYLNAATINAPGVRIFTPPTAPKKAYFPIPTTTSTTTTTEKVVAIISQSQSISSSSTSTSFHLPRPEPLIQTTTMNPVPTTSTTTERTNWEESEKVWGEPERVWGVPEEVWGTPESSTNYTTTTPSPFQDLDSDSEEEYESAKYYELGEDESDEPRELSLDPDSMRSKLENAQLISRHYELPELKMSLKHGSTIPLMTIESPGGGTESFQITEDAAVTTESSLVPIEPVFGDRLSTTERPPGKKFGYVLDGPGSDIRKYRVEERTSDGYIVGEYGVINQENGFLRGVRYTADGTINPRLIHETLMKFLSL